MMSHPDRFQLLDLKQIKGPYGTKEGIDRVNEVDTLKQRDLDGGQHIRV